MTSEKERDEILKESSATPPDDIDAVSPGEAEVAAHLTEAEAKPVGISEKEYQEKIRTLEDKYLRLAAEFDNYKKRTARQFEEIIRGANESLIIQILDVVDDFHRALESAQNGPEAPMLYRGMEMIYQRLDSILRKEGLEHLKALGEKFDPGLHEAVMQVDSEEFDDGVIAQEIAAGFRLKGKVIRHSKVAVSRGKPQKRETSPGDAESLSQ